MKSLTINYKDGTSKEVNLEDEDVHAIVMIAEPTQDHKCMYDVDLYITATDRVATQMIFELTKTLIEGDETDETDGL